MFLVFFALDAWSAVVFFRLDVEAPLSVVVEDVALFGVALGVTRDFINLKNQINFNYFTLFLKKFENFSYQSDARFT